jgi:membrane-associated phospholipid phosphatase
VHDGLGFAWTGGNQLAPVVGRMGTASDTDITYLGSETQGDLAMAMLSQDFAVTGTDGKAILSVGGTNIARIEVPSRAFFQTQLVFLRSYADLRADRLGEIDVQIDDMLSFFGLVGLLDDGRRKHTLALLGLVIRLAEHLEMPMKHFCRSLRPIDLSPMVHPVIQTPDHSSFPSGHAMEAFAAATVLDRLIAGKVYGVGGRTSLPFQIAHRIATNRTVAGVHFPVDSLAGALVGCRIGDAVWRLANGIAANGVLLDFTPNAGGGMTAGGRTWTASDDFLLGDLDLACPRDTAVPGTSAGIIGTIWNKAAQEW